MIKLNGFNKWGLSFLAVLATAIIMELYAIFDGNPSTYPLTWLIISNIPSYIGMPLIVGFCVWLIAHFYKEYKEVEK